MTVAVTVWLVCGLLGVDVAAGVVDRGADGGGDRGGKQRHHDSQHQDECLDPIGGADEWIAAQQPQQNRPPRQSAR